MDGDETHSCGFILDSRCFYLDHSFINNNCTKCPNFLNERKYSYTNYGKQGNMHLYIKIADGLVRACSHIQLAGVQAFSVPSLALYAGQEHTAINRLWFRIALLAVFLQDGSYRFACKGLWRFFGLYIAFAI